MSKFIADQRIGQLELELLGDKNVEISFDGDDVTGNAGVLLLAQAEKLTGLIAGADKRLKDRRTASLIKHNQFELIAQRVFQIAAGYSAADDSDFLRADPAIKGAVGRNALSDADLSSQPTQQRFETSRSFKELYRLCEWLVDYYIQCHSKAPKHITLDFDGSAIETYGLQLQAFYRSGPYRKFMYFPLFVFDESGWLLVAALRPGDHGEVQLALPVLKRLVKKLREAWPKTRITVRADGAFTDNALYQWMDENNVDYVLGLKHNNALLTHSRQSRDAAKKKFKRKFGQSRYTGVKGQKRKLDAMKTVRSHSMPGERQAAHDAMNTRRVRVFGDFIYGAKSWDKERRVVCRCDFDDDGLNVRYVVTSFKKYTAEHVYERIYCNRARIELWIKQLKETRCDRMSCAQFKSNMFRLLFHAMAYILCHQVRKRLPDGERMSINTLRRMFINVAAHVYENAETVGFCMSSSYISAKTFRLTSKRLGARSLIAA